MIADGGLFTGETLKDDPEQMVAVCAGTMGNGRTVIVLVRISEPQSMLEASTPTVYVPGLENNTVMDELPLATGKLPRFPNDPLVTVYPGPEAFEELFIYQPKSKAFEQFPFETEKPPFEELVNVID